MITLASIFIALSALLSLGFGVVYLFRTNFMKYHREALQTNWEQVTVETQRVILALMRTVSGGLISVGVTILSLQYQFIYLKEPWIVLCILLSGGIMTLCKNLSIRFTHPMKWSFG